MSQNPPYPPQGYQPQGYQQPQASQPRIPEGYVPKPSGFRTAGGQTQRWDAGVNWYDTPENEFTRLRFLGPVLTLHQHWLKSKNNKNFAMFCRNWDFANQAWHDEAHQDCPICKDFPEVKDLSPRATYLAHAIVRALNTVKPMRLNGTVRVSLDRLSQVNVHTFEGRQMAVDITDPYYGMDIFYFYAPRDNNNKHQVSQAGHSSLTEQEMQYLNYLTDWKSLIRYEPVAEIVRSLKINGYYGHHEVAPAPQGLGQPTDLRGHVMAAVPPPPSYAPMPAPAPYPAPQVPPLAQPYGGGMVPPPNFGFSPPPPAAPAYSSAPPPPPGAFSSAPPPGAFSSAPPPPNYGTAPLPPPREEINMDLIFGSNPTPPAPQQHPQVAPNVGKSESLGQPLPTLGNAQPVPVPQQPTLAAPPPPPPLSVAQPIMPPVVVAPTNLAPPQPSQVTPLVQPVSAPQPVLQPEGSGRTFSLMGKGVVDEAGFNTFIPAHATFDRAIPLKQVSSGDLVGMSVHKCFGTYAGDSNCIRCPIRRYCLEHK